MATANTPDPGPVVFTARGLEIDTRLRVFDTVFHVHSTILRLHSQYFYKFLDSADKAAGMSNEGFKYDWVTKIVDGGKDWQLAGDLNLPEWKTCPHVNSGQRMQTNAFHNVLRAMYALPYILNHGHSIIIMTELARFYMCLPIISRTLDGAISRSPRYFGIQVRNSRSHVIFEKGMAAEAVATRESENSTSFTPRLLKSMCEEAEKQYDDDDSEDLYRRLKWLLRNDLSMDLGSLRVAGSEDSGYPDHFLLSTISDDDDYPWDVTQSDW
ncbi:hypothetical protein DL95DRAFT_364805 [Leptodontidium sp. 2 PMI_412]|nr:hypothetical protein DL95DRAFT_364805 [Leptodontidium sp. 2 PMI_412]